MVSLDFYILDKKNDESTGSDSDSDSDAGDSSDDDLREKESNVLDAGQKIQRAGTKHKMSVRNLRLREDTAK